MDQLPARPSFFSDPVWILIPGGLFLLFCWLLGSYTILRWSTVPTRMIIYRLLLSLCAAMSVSVLIVWCSQVPVTVAASHRLLLSGLFVLQGIWSLLLRLSIRHFSRLSPERRWQLMAEPIDLAKVQDEWKRNPFVQAPQPLHPKSSAASQGLVLGSNLNLSPSQRAFVRELTQRGIPLTTLESLAERQLERLPPALLPDEWLAFSDIPWSSPFNIDRQLKRTADVLVSLILLLLFTPLLLLAACCIWVEDRGPILFKQTRTGWMGAPFQLYKLRTMRSSDEARGSVWTLPRDSRITMIGQVLRRFRIDELPQLVNVLRGEMSLIGPRPERPELDHALSLQIPHYQKRYWMLPGLSGWAQVCAPYASSIEDTEHKLSYDLYYLRHFSTGLDLLILTKTIKTILRARGR
jgi:lipopolysaccharide/colanic/teichoic acid biosynthesis glycosyltransferase